MLKGSQLIACLRCRHIYGKATHSIVWLHSTSWSDQSALKALINLRLPQSDNTESIDIQKCTDEVLRLLGAARTDERLLAPGWTLQEVIHISSMLMAPGSLEIVTSQELRQLFEISRYPFPN
jgi:hypothetical protein